MQDVRQALPAGNRFVLFVDVLGYKQLRQDLGHEGVTRRVVSCIQALTGYGWGCLHFSDTIVVYAAHPGGGATYWDDFIVVASRSFAQLLSEGVPVRGGLAYGEFDVLRREEPTFDSYYGQALIDAALEEQRHNFIGVAVHSSFAEAVDARFLRHHKSQSTVCQLGDSLVLNPFRTLSEWTRDGRHSFDQPADIFDQWNSEWRSLVDPEVQALKFIDDGAKRDRDDPRVHAKYEASAKLYRSALGDECYEWAVQAANLVTEKMGTT